MTTSHLSDGLTTLTPLLVVCPASATIDFYTAVLGARVTTRMDGPDGSVWHAELDLGGGRLQVMNPNPQFHAVGNDPTSDDAQFSLAVYVPDVDATVARARELGARVRGGGSGLRGTGDRFGSVQDPFGVRWTIMTRTVARSDAEVQEALDAWRATMTAG